jgi:predicted dienelactone hydrolase
LPLYALQSTALLEEIASHGYIVVSITHPGDAVDHKLADGRVIPTIALATKQAPYAAAKQRMNYADNFADRVAAVAEYSRLLPATRIGESAVAWREDALFALQSVEDGAVPAPVAEVLRQANLKKVAMTGMSFGGDVAAGACHATPICTAAINMDGGPYDTTLFNRALNRPFLMVMSDWLSLPVDNHSFPKGYHPDDLQFERWSDAGLTPDVVRVRIRNIRHMALTDLPYLMQDPGREAALGTADPQRSGAALSHIFLAFLDTYLKGAPRSAITHVLTQYADTADVHDPAALRDWARKNPALAASAN